MVIFLDVAEKGCIKQKYLPVIVIVLLLNISCCRYVYRLAREEIPLGSAFAGTTLELRDINAISGVAQLWIGVCVLWCFCANYLLLDCFLHHID